ncbi:Uncharacterised protein [Vibrio cholerae]|nr:Uncharacterised protein [Vibrio cholerae]
MRLGSKVLSKQAKLINRQAAPHVNGVVCTYKGIGSKTLDS